MVDLMQQNSDEEEDNRRVQDAVARAAMGKCQRVWIAANNNPRFLMAMCIGFRDKRNERDLCDFDGDDIVYNNLPDKNTYNPTVPMLKVEVKRRAKDMKLTVATSTMSRPRLNEWLKEHRVMNCMDEAWLQKEEYNIYTLARDAIAEKEQLAADRLRNSNWNSPFPHLRLYLSMCHDDARQALFSKDNCLERDELDAGHSAERPPTYEEAVALVYNNRDYVFCTEALPNLHENFSEPIELIFSEMPGGAITAEDVKARIGDARAKLIQAS